MIQDMTSHEFYNANKDKIGFIGSMSAEQVVSYYSLRWQLYNAGQKLSGVLENPDSINMAEVSSETKRLQKRLSDTCTSASAAVKALHNS
jgi:hypothetical protein